MQEDENKSKTENDTNWTFREESEDSNLDTSNGEDNIQPRKDPITWTASEFVAHQKDNNWYMFAVAAGVGLAAVIFFFTRDIFSTAMVIVAAGIFIAAAARPPRVLHYSLDSRGLMIGSKLYAYEKFKAYSVINEGVFRSISLDPLERFMPSMTIYYDPADEQKITNVLGSYLPYEERQQAPIDKMMRKIRF